MVVGWHCYVETPVLEIYPIIFEGDVACMVGEDDGYSQGLSRHPVSHVSVPRLSQELLKNLIKGGSMNKAGWL